MSILSTKGLTISYEGRTIIDGLNLQLSGGKIHSILGPNGCGKSTLLKALARQMKAQTGVVYLDGKDIHTMGAKAFAQKLAFLMQNHESLTDMNVRELIACGRFPHKALLQRANEEDERIVAQSMELTGVAAMADRRLATLSGGERQRAWIALALAQQPSVLLLDEPTTYLDIKHQLEIMELVVELNGLKAMTIVMVLHDINHAAAYSDQIIMMKEGAIYSDGSPEEVIIERNISEVFGVSARIHKDENSGRPLVMAMSLARR
jgi:iron complex transport system ATP-binding protein